MNFIGETGEINRNVSLEKPLVRSAVFMYRVYKSSLSCPRHRLAIPVAEPQLKTCCSWKSSENYLDLMFTSAR